MGENSSNSRSDSNDKQFVIGQELADARSAEKRRSEEAGSFDSPFPETKYDFWNGDLSLISPKSNPLDEKIRELCSLYAQTDPDARLRTRQSISMDQFYTLINFARRSAVFGLGKSDAGHVAKGLTAIAMIEKERVDYRDILVCLALLYHTGRKTGGNVEEMFHKAAGLAEPEVAELILGFSGQTSDSWSLCESWGYDEIETENGFGFIGRGFADYNPNIDLSSVTIAIADLLAADSYMPSQIEIATELPDVWFGGNKNAAAAGILSNVRGGASISASLHPDKHSDHASQQLTVFLVETEKESDARGLCIMAGSEMAPEHSYLALAKSRLFLLVVARSFVEGVATFETDKSLERFAAGFSGVLERYSQVNQES